jgi:hypothetical protein
MNIVVFRVIQLMSIFVYSTILINIAKEGIFPIILSFISGIIISLIFSFCGINYKSFILSIIVSVFISVILSEFYYLLSDYIIIKSYFVRTNSIVSTLLTTFLLLSAFQFCRSYSKNLNVSDFNYWIRIFFICLIISILIGTLVIIIAFITSYSSNTSQDLFDDFKRILSLSIIVGILFGNALALSTAINAKNRI